MTIAVGLLAYDAVILAADSQLTAGDWKLNEAKVYGSSKRASNAALTLGMTGAGYVANLKAFWQDLVDKGTETPETMAELEAHCRRTIAEFHQSYILPFAAFPDHARPGIDLIIAGASLDGGLALWTSSNATFVRETFFTAVGTGSLLARSLMRRSAIWRLSIEDAVLLAVDLIDQVKESDTNCGKRTHILVINNRGMCPIVGNLVQDAEVLCQQYRDFAPTFFWGALGAVSVDATAEIGAFRKRFEPLRAEIRRQLEAKRLWPFASSSAVTFFCLAPTNDQISSH